MEGLKIHWKAPLQPKGFIKFIEMSVAVLALSLVAGFVARQDVGCSVEPSDNSSAEEQNLVLSIAVPYPFNYAHLTLSEENLLSQEPATLSPAAMSVEISSKSYMQSAQFFVAWGSLTLFYGVIAIVVYMTTTANEKIEWLVNFFVLVDLIFHIVWVLCWFIASVEWAVAQNDLRKYLNGTLAPEQVQLINCTSNLTFDPGSYVQAAIGDVFGFASLILWLCNVYFVCVDTTWYLQWRSSRLGDYGAIDP